MSKIDDLIEKLENENEKQNTDLKEFFRKEMIETLREDKEKDMNKPFIISYKNIVDKTSAFLNSELLVEDPITASVIFEYLLWNGYFSKNNFYQYRMDERINNFSGFGADIMRGNGVCLNNATMLSDVLKSMDYNACTSVCYVHENAEIPDEKREKMPIDRSVYKGNTLLEKLKVKKAILASYALRPITKKVGNHAIVLSEYNGEFYGIDPTNLCFMTHSNENQLQSLNGLVDFDLKPTFTHYLNSDEVDNIKEMYENMNKFANKDVSFLAGNSIKDFYQEKVEFCDSKKNILKDFHEECLNDIDIVCKTLTKNKIR